MKKLALILAMLLPSSAFAAVINVNSGMSEATIQGLINGGTSGDTVSFAAGAYNLASNGSNPNSAALVLKAGLFYTGPTSGTAAHLVGAGCGSGCAYPLMYFSGTTVNVQYLTFDNGIIFLDDHTTSATIDNNLFENIDCGTVASQVTAVFVAGGINNSDISYNTFSNIGASCFAVGSDAKGAGGITFYAFHDVTVNHNTFINVHEAIDIPDSGGGGYDGAGSQFDYNTGTGIHRIFIELLGTSTIPSGLEVAFNNYSNPLNPYFASMCLSLTAGQNMIAHDNVCNGNLNSPQAPPYGIEIAGVTTQAYNNTVEGYFQLGFAIGNTLGPISITNNKICGPTMNSAPGSGSVPSVGNANGFISWEGSSQGGTFTGNTTSAALTCASGTVALTTNVPPYGFQVMNGSVRQVAVYPSGSGATTKLVNWSTTSGATLGCTSNCLPTTSVKITAAGGTCSVTGSVGSYVLHSTSDVTVTATSVDDPTKTVTIPFHVCDTSVDAYVKVEPAYEQAFQGQKKTLQSYVIGYINQNVTWAITSAPGGGNATLSDTANRDTIFNSGTVTGRYIITATSVANGSIAGTAIVYVSPNALPAYAITPNKTVPAECYVDPALTGTVYEVGPTQAYTSLTTLGTNAWTGTGNIIRIHNEDTTGHSPTTFHEVMQIEGTGTATQPINICGVPDSLGNLPIIDGANATEDPTDDCTYLSGAGGFKFLNSGGSHFNEGFELGSVGPDYVRVAGIRFQHFDENYSYHACGSGSLTPYREGTAAIYLRAGQHLLYEGNDSYQAGFFVLANNNTSATGRTFAQFHQYIGNHISNFGDNGAYTEHAIYGQAMHTLIEANLIESPVANDNGDFMKVRGTDSIIRYNTFLGTLGGHVIEYPDMEDTFQFVGVDMNLGVPGDTTCADSIWCTVTSNNITLTHLTDNAEAMAKDFAYGNLSATTTGGFQTIQYGSFSAPEECPPCTNMDDRQGRLYFFYNTVDKPDPTGFITTANSSSGSFPALPQYTFLTQSLYNNVFWKGSSFLLNEDATMIPTFLTNMYQAGSISITTPITGGSSAGWGGYIGPYAYPLANPMNTHMTGQSSPNFLTASTQPYNATTFLPNTGSPLLNAATAITDPEISNMPIRYQPNPNGWVAPRTDGATTIAALGPGVTTVANPTCTPPSGAYATTQAVICSSTTPSSTTYCTIDGSTPTSGSPVCTGITVSSTLTLKAISEASGATNSGMVTVPYTIVPTVASILVSPSSATILVGGTQPFTCTATMSDSSTQSCSSAGITTWMSSSPSIATVNSSGLAIGVSGGSATIGAAISGVTPSSAALTVNAMVVANPTFAPPAGTYAGTQSVTIATSTSGASIVYTNDGTTPTVTSLTCTITNGTLYTGPVSVSTTQTLNALGCKAGDTASSAIPAVYTIVPIPLPVTQFAGHLTLSNTH